MTIVRRGGPAPTGASGQASVPLIATDGTDSYYGGRVQLLADAVIPEAAPGVPWVVFNDGSPLDINIGLATSDYGPEDEITAGIYVLVAHAPDPAVNPGYSWPTGVVPLTLPMQPQVAYNVPYDNSTSGLTAADVNSAIDEVAARPRTFPFDLALYGYSASTAGAQQTIHAVASGDTYASPVVLPTTLPAADHGFQATVAKAPAFSAGTVGLHLEVMVANAAGTEKLVVKGFLPVTTGADWLAPDMTGWEVVEAIGTDLSINADGSTIDSAAGGQFLASASYKLTTSGLVP